MQTDTVNALTLAWIGDAVCHEAVRLHLVARSDAKVHRLEKLSTGFVSAKAQAAAFDRLIGELDDEEQSTARRALNAHFGHVPKNATAEEYRKATAIEAVLGSLKLQNKEERLREVLRRMIAICEE